MVARRINCRAALLVGMIAFFGWADISRAQQTLDSVVDDHWISYSVNWNGGGLGDMLIRASLGEYQGKFMLCGALSMQGRVTHNRQWLRAAVLLVNDQEVLRDFTFMERHSARHMRSELVGFEATCQVTNVDVPNRANVTWTIINVQDRYRR